MSSGSDVVKQPQPLLCPVANCALTVDVVIKSSDGRLFGAHSQNLAGYSGGFPPASFASPDTVRDLVELSERALVIEYMLNYMHNHRLTVLNGLSSADVKDIAYAAEKYFIYSLMEVCRLHMYRFLKVNPMMVLAYAANHGYDDLFDEAVPMSLGHSLEEMYGYLGATAYFVAWVRYSERLLQLRDCFRGDPPAIKHKGGLDECSLWPEFIARLLRMEVSEAFEWKIMMRGLANTTLEQCSWCSQRATNWIARMPYGIDITVKASSLK